MDTDLTMQSTLKTCLLLALATFSNGALALDAWPATASQTAISSIAASEPSGLIYESRQDKLYFVGINKVHEMNPDGSNLKTWTVSYSDLEGITTTDTIPAGKTRPYLYLAQEDPATIAEFDPSTGTLTGKHWSVSGSGLIDATDASKRMEGFTFVPDGHHPWGVTSSGGVFLISMQNGHPASSSGAPIIAVNIDLSGTSVSKITEWVPIENQTDISDLFYSTLTKQLFILYDAGNNLVVEKMDATHTQLKNYTLPGTTTTQEAFVMIPNASCTGADVYIGEDGTGNIWQLSEFPYSCILPSNQDGGSTGGSTNTPGTNSSGSSVDSSCRTGSPQSLILILISLLIWI